VVGSNICSVAALAKVARAEHGRNGNTGRRQLVHILALWSSGTLTYAVRGARNAKVISKKKNGVPDDAKNHHKQRHPSHTWLSDIE
jgi:hypothetical protein